MSFHRAHARSPAEMEQRCSAHVDLVPGLANGAGRRRPTRAMTVDPSLQAACDALALPGIMIGHRLISPGDEHALLPDEAPAFLSSVLRVRRASGAARIVARELLARLGHAQWPVVRSASGAPVWPVGVVGSLAHDARAAVATVGLARDINALGIDIEPAEQLP